LAATRGGFEFAGFVNDAGELFDDFFFGKTLSAFDIDEGDVGATEEFFHVAGVTAGVVGVAMDVVFEFDGTDRTQGVLVAEYEIDGFVIDETVGGVAVLSADFVAEEGREVDIRDDVEFFAEKMIKHLETLFFGANHEMLAGAILEVVDGLTLAATSGDADEDGDQKE